jgi:dipeptidyl aminopeptidase/acylaminoacyl peptidase
MVRLFPAALLSLFLFAAGCADPKSRPAEATDTFTFAGRPIQLDTLLSGFPFRLVTASYEAGSFFFIEKGQTDTLKSLPLGSGQYLSKGTPLTETDFAKRSISGIRYRSADSSLYWTGDEANEERFNVYSMPAKGGELKKVTDVPYVFGWDWSEGESQLAFVVREGERDQRKGQVSVLDFGTGEIRQAAEDNPKLRYTWGEPRWKPDSSGLVINALRRGDRGFANLIYLDLRSGRQTLLTDSTRMRSNLEVLRYWPSSSEFLYLSNETGYRNLYLGNVFGRGGRPITQFEEDISGVEPIERNGEAFLLVSLTSPTVTRLVVVHPRTGQTLLTKTVNGQVSLLDSREYKVLIQTSSAINPFQLDELSVLADTILTRPVMSLPETLTRQLVRAKAEAVQFPTFDSVNGQVRMLHGYLYQPANPLPKGKEILMIQSFYGGENRYQLQPQVFAAAGMYVFSPAPRGSAGFGREFAALNDKDLGGNEIIDVMYAAKFVSEKLGIPPQRIGAFGGSHGGYATMRLLTFPGQINGVSAEFPWGFGVSHAGFSDIIDFYNTCNIPDWVTLEAGDPVTEAEKLKDRSPLYHAEKAMGPLLLTHGTNDNRVPIKGSRDMNDSLLYYGKEVTLIEFPEQGHSIQGLDNQRYFYQVWLEFIEKSAGLAERE